MKKKRTLLLAVAGILTLVGLNVYAAADCNNVTTFAGFKALSDGKCDSMVLKSIISIPNTEQLTVRPLTAGGVLDLNIGTSENIGIFLQQGASVTFENSKIYVDGGLGVSMDSTVFCNNCSIQNNILNAGTILLNGSISSLPYNKLAISNNEKSLLLIMKAKFVDKLTTNSGNIVSNEFLVKSSGTAIKISTSPNNGLSILKNNKFILSGDGSLDLTKLLSWDNTTNISKLPQPSVEYLGSDSEDKYYVIKIKNTVTTNKWGNFTCSGYGVQSNVFFEPYLLRYNDAEQLTGVYPINIYYLTESDSQKTVRIPKDKISVKITDEEIVTSLDGEKIAMLVHCEGIGTTRFSAPLKMELSNNCMTLDAGTGACLKCDADNGYYLSGGECLACTGAGMGVKDNSCQCIKAGYTVYNNQCVTCNEAGKIDEDGVCTACNADEIIKDNVCTECDEGYVKDGNSCKRDCGDNAELSGNVCKCKEGYAKYLGIEDARCVYCDGTVTNGVCKCSNKTFEINLKGECVAETQANLCKNLDENSYFDETSRTCLCSCGWDPGPSTGVYAPFCKEPDDSCVVKLDCSLDENKTALECDCSLDANKDAEWCGSSGSSRSGCGCNFGTASAAAADITIPLFAVLSGLGGLLYSRRRRLH